MVEKHSSIRLAVPADAAAIALLHVRSWQWVYRGLVPDHYLDGLSDRVSEWELRWVSRLQGSETGVCHWLVEHLGQISGFSVVAPSRDHSPDSGVGELRGLYLDPDATGIGLGRALMTHAVAYLRGRGYKKAILWVLEGNARARRFYENSGWRPDGQTRVERRPGFELREVRYEIDLSSGTAASGTG